MLDLLVFVILIAAGVVVGLIAYHNLGLIGSLAVGIFALWALWRMSATAFRRVVDLWDRRGETEDQRVERRRRALGYDK